MVHSKLIRKLKRAKKRIRESFDKCIKDIAIQGPENIKSELLKEKQDAYVSFSIKKNNITFTTTPKIEQIKSEDLSKKEIAKFEKLGVPIEMLSAQSNEQEFCYKAVNRAMERTQENLIKKVEKVFKDIL